MVLHPGAPEGSTGSGSGFKVSLKTGLHYFLWLFLGSNQYWAERVYGSCVYFMTEAPKGSTKSGSGEAGNRVCGPLFTRHSANSLHLFVAFLGRSQIRQIWFVCWLYDGNTPRLTECGFMEKLRIKHLLGKTTFSGFPGYKPVLPGWFKICVLVLWRKHPKASHTWFYGEAGESNLRPLVYKAKLFVAFLGISQFRLVGLRFVCWFYDRKTQRLTETGFMEKLGIEPVTSGLQGKTNFLWISWV